MDKDESASEKNNHSVPEWQIAIVRERMAAYESNTEIALDFDKAMDDIENMLDKR